MFCFSLYMRTYVYTPQGINIISYNSSYYLSSMEASESLSIESFSYSWLVNLKPSFESSFRDSFDDSNFIEMDPKLSASKRFLVFHQDFDFDLPTLQPCVHADELISNGIVVPLFLKKLDIGIGIYDSGSSSTPVSPVSSASHGRRQSRSLFFRRYRRLPKSVVRKYLNLVRLLWLRMRRGKSDSDSGPSTGIIMPSSDNWLRSCDSDSGKMLGFEGMLSPRISEADNWRRSCDSESSIYEAVLHCKKTIGCK